MKSSMIKRLMNVCESPWSHIRLTQLLKVMSSCHKIFICRILFAYHAYRNKEKEFHIKDQFIMSLSERQQLGTMKVQIFFVTNLQTCWRKRDIHQIFGAAETIWYLKERLKDFSQEPAGRNCF